MLVQRKKNSEKLKLKFFYPKPLNFLLKKSVTRKKFVWKSKL